MHKINLIFHLAGFKDVSESNKHPEKYIKNNLTKSKKFIETCIKNNCRKIIFSSSAAVYGNLNKNNLKEHSILKPSSIYGKTKLK